MQNNPGGSMETTLIEKLDKLTDRRRSQGKRHKVSTVVIITILAIISQIYTLRGIETFIKRHRTKLIELLNIGKNGLPSFYVLRTVLQQIDFNELSAIIKEWLIEQNMLSPDEWISIDGKCIKSTVSDYNSSNQDFVSIVTAFSHKSGVAILSAKFQSKKISEIDIADALIKEINLASRTFTLDALHCKKNS
jgi:hypothetical protein